MKSITVLLYDFSFKNENLATSIFVVKQSKTSKDFFKNLSICYQNIFYVVFCFFKCILILLMGNVKSLSLNCFHSLFIHTKINKQTKQNKTVVKVHESLLFTCWEVKKQIMSISRSTC